MYIAPRFCKKKLKKVRKKLKKGEREEGNSNIYSIRKIIKEYENTKRN